MRKKRVNKGYTRAPKKKSKYFLEVFRKIREGESDYRVSVCIIAYSSMLSVQDLRYLAHTITNYKDRRRYDFPITQRLIHLLIAKRKLEEEADYIYKETKGQIQVII